MDPFGGQTRVPPERATPEMTHFGTIFGPLWTGLCHHGIQWNRLRGQGKGYPINIEQHRDTPHPTCFRGAQNGPIWGISWCIGSGVYGLRDLELVEDGYMKTCIAGIQI